MRVITAGSALNPETGDGRGLAFLIAIFGYTILGYVAATSATFCEGWDTEENEAPLTGWKENEELRDAVKD